MCVSYTTNEDIIYNSYIYIQISDNIFTGILCVKNYVFRNPVPHVPGGGTILYVRHMMIIILTDAC